MDTITLRELFRRRFLSPGVAAGAALDDAVAAAVIEDPARPLFLTLAQLASLAEAVGLDPTRLRVSVDGECEVQRPTFGAKLRELRVDNKLTQTQAAARAGVPLGSWQQYEGDRRNPTFATVVKICRAFGLDVNYFSACDFGQSGGQE